MQSNPRLSANLPVISVKLLVNLLVKLTKLGLGGHGGGLYPLPEPSSKACTLEPTGLGIETKETFTTTTYKPGL